MEKFSTENEELVIRIPLKQRCSNVYDDELGETDNIVGVANEKVGIGFYQLIDMSYKGKSPQLGGLLCTYGGDSDSFRKLCKKLKIDIWEFSVCAYCGEPIYGCFVGGKKGNMCMHCYELKKENDKRKQKE